jgi:hypothetical protein
MKKFMSILLGLSLAIGSATLVSAQEKGKEDGKTEKGKGKGKGKKGKDGDEKK